MLRPRVKAFLLFLTFAALSQIFEPLLSWLVLMKAHAVDRHDLSWRPSLFIWFESCATVGALAATWIVARIGQRRFASLGYATNRVGQHLLFGSLFGLGAVCALVGAIAALGGFLPGHLMMSGTRLAIYVIGWLITFFLLGMAEEARFAEQRSSHSARRSVSGRQRSSCRRSLARSITSEKGPAENLADALSVSLIGLFMAFTVMRTGSIWFAVGFHALFDYTALYIFGAPNSGNRGGTPVDTRLLSGTFHGPSWLTGGPLGVEASWLVFPVIVLLFLIFDRTDRAARPLSLMKPALDRAATGYRSN
jgi:membrane protease YdiL (CAAX protease family)